MRPAEGCCCLLQAEHAHRKQLHAAEAFSWVSDGSDRVAGKSPPWVTNHLATMISETGDPPGDGKDPASLWAIWAHRFHKSHDNMFAKLIKVLKSRLKCVAYYTASQIENKIDPRIDPRLTPTTNINTNTFEGLKIEILQSATHRVCACREINT